MSKEKPTLIIVTDNEEYDIYQNWHHMLESIAEDRDKALTTYKSVYIAIELSPDQVEQHYAHAAIKFHQKRIDQFMKKLIGEPEREDDIPF